MAIEWTDTPRDATATCGNVLYLVACKLPHVTNWKWWIEDVGGNTISDSGQSFLADREAAKSAAIAAARKLLTDALAELGAE